MSKRDNLEREESAFRETLVYHYHRKKQKQMEQTTEEQSLQSLVTLFLADLAHANQSPHTCRAYATDKAIPAEHLRDRLFFRLLAETGLRVSEGLSLYVEDLDLSLDNEHLTVVGRGGKRRTVLLDDPRLVQQLRAYLKRMGYKHGPLFQAEKNGRGGPLRYQSMQERWDHYCSQAGVACTLHQLRHSHATELINGGVSLPTIRKRLGHKNLQTTLRYAEQADATADAEVRAWRRQHDQHSSFGGRREGGSP